LVGFRGNVLIVIISVTKGTVKLVQAVPAGSVCGEVIAVDGTRDGLVLSSSTGEIINYCFE